MEAPNEVCRGDGKNRLDAQTYRAIQFAKLKKLTAKRRYNMSPDSGNDLHVEGSRKSDDYCERCETSCKRQRVGLTKQRQICSSEAVTASQQMFTHSKDFYTQEIARSPHMDVLPVSMEEGEIIGANDDVYSHESARSPQMHGSLDEIVGANEDVYTQKLARSPHMDVSVSPISVEEGEIIGANDDVYSHESARCPQTGGSLGKIIGANEDVYTQELARSPQMDGSPISKEEGERVGDNENGIDASHDQSQLTVHGSPMALPAGLDNLRFREYWVPVRLSSTQLEQYCSTLMKNSGLLCSSAKRGNLNPLQDALCTLRKCCDHPYLLDSTLSTFARKRSPSVDDLSIGIQASGKLQLLRKFLPQIREQGLRVLIVYKSNDNSVGELGVGHILDDFICRSFGQESYVHIYTPHSVRRKEKQAAIDIFNDKTSGRFVVLTEYKSSLASIRLSSVDVVILFNSGWNPVNDIRALKKMTLHTEKDHLSVFRLYSACTLEEKALGLARDDAAVKSVSPFISRITCNMLLAWGAAYLFEKLDALYAVDTSETTKSLEDDFLGKVIHELSTILSSNIDHPSISCSVISNVSVVGEGYSGNVKLHGELEVQPINDDVPSNVFWSSLLDDRSHRWRFLPVDPESLERRRIPLYEWLPEMFEGGFPETGVPDKEMPIWFRGRSNAKRSKRGRRCVWNFEGQQQERGEMGRMNASSKLAGKSVSPYNGMTSFLADCTTQGTEANLSPEMLGLRSMNKEISEHIHQIGEIHQRHMQELEKKQKNEVLEYFRSKKETRERMQRVYALQKVLICELYGESLPKLEKLKKLDETFQIKFEGLRREMKKCWENLKAAHETARTNEEEMRSKMICLLKKSTARTLPEDSDGAEVSAPSTSIDSGNRSSLDIVEVSPDNPPMKDLMAIPVDPDRQIQEVSAPGIMDESVISGSSSVEQLDALDDPITPDDPTILPVCSTLLHSKLSPGNWKDSQGQVLKDSSVTESQGPQKSVQDLNDEVVRLVPLNVEDFEISLDRWTIEEVTLKNDHNQVSQGLLSSSVLITDGQSPKENEQSVSNGVVPHNDPGIFPECFPTNEMTVAMDFDNEQIFVGSVPVPVDELAVPVPSSRNQLDVLSAPVTPDNNHALQNPITESQGPWDGMTSSDELAVPSDKIGCSHDTLCKDTPNIYVISDDEQMHEASAATPVNELQDANNLSEEVPSTSSEQINPLTVGCSTNEQAACLSSMGNQHEVAQIMSNGVATGISSPCVALAGGSYGSMDQDTAVEELRQQSQTNTPADLCSLGLTGCTPCSTLQQHCTDQGRQLPLEQARTTEPPPCSDIRVTDGFLSLPSLQYVGTGACSQHLQSSVRASLLGPAMSTLFDAFSNQTDNHLMMPQIARGTEENTHPQLSYPGGNYQLYNSRSFDIRSNSHQPVSLDPLQNKLEEINKETDEALKKHKDMVVQLAAAREQEKAQIDQKYTSLFQNAQSDWMQTREELKLCFEKTKAQKLLADAWRLKIEENSPLDIEILPSSPLQSNGLPSATVMQRNVSAHSHQFANQFSDLTQTNHIVRLPSSQMHSTGLPLANGLQRNVSPHSRQFANHFSNVVPTDQIVRPPHPPSRHPLYISQGRWGPYVPDPHLRPSLPGASIPLHGYPQSQMNQHALNFCSPGSATGSSAGSYSQPYNFGDYLAPPYNAPN